MLWFLLLIPATFFIFKELWFGSLGPENFVEWMVSTMFGVILMLIVAAACAGMAAVIGLVFPSYAVEIGRSELVAIRDKDGSTGRFFLGTGMIKSEQYYFYYERRPDGGFRPGKVSAEDGVRIYEEHRNDAELVRFSWEVNSWWASMVAFPVNAGGYSYDFHVPKGTIRTGFTM